MFFIEEIFAVVILALLFSAALLVVVSLLMVVRQQVQWLVRASLRLATSRRHVTDNLWRSVVTR